MSRLLLTCFFMAFSLLSLSVQAQCPITTFTNTFDGIAPFVTDCSIFIESDQNIFSGETYTLDGVVEGQTYVVDLCGANVWNATLSVYDGSESFVAYDDGITSGCGMGARVSFTAASSGSYSIVCSKADCSIDLSGNGKVKVFNNTDGINPCPNATGIECTVAPSFLGGLESTGLSLSTLPIVTCGADWGMGENPLPEKLFVAMGAYDDFSNQPYTISTNKGQIFATNDLTNPSTDLTVNIGIAVLLGLSQEDIDDPDDIVITFTSATNETCIGNLNIISGFLPADVAAFCPSDVTAECVADVGTITAPANLSYGLDGLTEAPNVEGQTVAAAYDYSFVLTTDLNPDDNTFLDILAINDNGIFDIAALGLTEGSYNVHGLSFNTAEDLPAVGSGEDLLNIIMEDDLCADLSGIAYTFSVIDDGNACLANAGTISAPSTTTYFGNETNEAPSLEGQNSGDGFGYFFVLTTDLDETDSVIFNIVALSSSGVFDFADLALAPGTYNVHGLSYSTDPALPDNLSSGEQVMGLIQDGSICADLTEAVFTITIEEVSGIGQIERVSRIKVHPVPANDFINVEFTSETIDYALWHVYDLSGQYIEGGEMNINPGSNSVKLEIYDFPQGVYFVELEGQFVNGTKRFIKN